MSAGELMLADLSAQELLSEIFSAFLSLNLH